MGNFCQESDDKNDTMPMEDMGRDASVIVGCHKQVSNLTADLRVFPKWKNTFEMWSNLWIQPRLNSHIYQETENLIS